MVNIYFYKGGGSKEGFKGRGLQGGLQKGLQVGVTKGVQRGVTRGCNRFHQIPPDIILMNSVLSIQALLFNGMVPRRENKLHKNRTYFFLFFEN